MNQECDEDKTSLGLPAPSRQGRSIDKNIDIARRYAAVTKHPSFAPEMSPDRWTSSLKSCGTMLGACHPPIGVSRETWRKTRLRGDVTCRAIEMWRVKCLSCRRNCSIGLH